MKGKYPRNYFLNPNMDKEKSIEQIWDDIDAYSGEYFEDEVNLHEKIDFFVPLPPLKYKDKFTKGIVFSQGMEYLLKLYPRLKEMFFCGAYTMWSSYSWCDKADFYLACYENKKRETYYKNKYPNKKNITFIPLQDADFTNEYKLAPPEGNKKTIDIISVATPLEVKNLPIIAKALKIYTEKYKVVPKVTFILGSKLIEKDENGNMNYSKMNPRHRGQMEQVDEILGDLKKHFEFLPWVTYSDIPKYYSSAKCCVLASLIEGKNRAINEAMSCDTPVVVFKQHNQWARGDYPIFFGNSGELVPEFTPEALADTFYKVINNQNNYEPRKNYLKYNGRKNFIDKLVSYIPYYSENIPDYNAQDFHDNIWLDLACKDNNQISYCDFLYSKKPQIQHARGLKNIEQIINYYSAKIN